MAWTTSGTISLTTNSATVVGSGTTWASDGVTSPGDTLLVNGSLYQVLSVQSDTQLTLAANYTSSTVSGQSYALIHTGLLPSALASNLASLQSKYLTTVSQLYNWETATSGTVPLTNPATGVTTNVTPLQAFMAASAQLSGAAFTGAISAPSISTASATLTGGTINGMSVGATTPAAGAFTTLSTTGALTAGGAISAPSMSVQGGASNAEFDLVTTNYGTLQVGQYSNGAFIGTTSTNATYNALRLGVGGNEVARLTASGFGYGVSVPGGRFAALADGTLPLFRGDQTAAGTSLVLSGPGSNFQIAHDGTTNVVVKNSGGGFNFQSNLGYAILDQYGNMGVRVTPSAWNGNITAIQLGAQGAIDYTSGSSSTEIRANSFNNSLGQETYIGANKAALLRVSAQDGSLQFFTAPTGAAGEAIAWTLAVSVLASADILTGTTLAPRVGGGGISTATGIFESQKKVTTPALNTNYQVYGGYVGGVAVVRNTSSGGTAVWLLDPNNGNVQISSNLSESISFNYLGSVLNIQQVSGTAGQQYKIAVLSVN